MDEASGKTSCLVHVAHLVEVCRAGEAVAGSAATVTQGGWRVGALSVDVFDLTGRADRHDDEAKR